MTTAQKTLYFRLWGAAFKANWIAKNSAAWPLAHNCQDNQAATPNSAPDATVEIIFRTPYAVLVEPQTEWAGLITAHDLRHRCHVIATGKAVSSKSATNAQLDRIFTLFKLLIDPDDLDAVLAWENPTQGQRKRMEHYIAKFNPHYVDKLLKNKFRAGHISELNEAQLKQLCTTLAHRPNAVEFRHPHPPESRTRPTVAPTTAAAAPTVTPPSNFEPSTDQPADPVKTFRPGSPTPFANRRRNQTPEHAHP